MFNWGWDWLGIPEDKATRVAQSVAVVRHVPMLVMGNGVGALVAMLALTGTFTLKQLLPLLIIPWLLQLPLIRSWVRLRGAPAPASAASNAHCKACCSWFTASIPYRAAPAVW